MIVRGLTARIVCDRCRLAPTLGDPQRDLVIRGCKGCGEIHDLCRRCVRALDLRPPRTRGRWFACPDALEVVREVMRGD